MNPKTPTTCEPTEERVRNLWTLVMGQSINDGCDAIRQALAQEAQRANELKEVDDVCYQQLRAKYVAADDRAEGLAKELEALRAQLDEYEEHANDLAEVGDAAETREETAIAQIAALKTQIANLASSEYDLTGERDAATARGAELEKQMAAMQSRAEAGEADWQTAEAELAKLREQVGAVGDRHLKTGSHTGSTCYTLLTDQRFVPVGQSRVKLSPSTNCDCGLMVETHTTGDGSIREHKASCAVRRGGQLTSAPPSPEGRPPATAGHNPEGVEARVFWEAHRQLVLATERVLSSDIDAALIRLAQAIRASYGDAPRPAEGPPAPAAPHEGEK